MGVLSVILLVLFVIASLLLIFIVAIQSESGTGLGGIFGGGSDSSFGSQTNKVITKATGILGAAFVVFAILLAVVNKTQSADSLLDSVKVEDSRTLGTWWEDDASK